MRRVLLILLVLAGLGILVWVLRRPRAAHGTEPLVEDPPPEPFFGPDLVEPGEFVVDAVSEPVLDGSGPAELGLADADAAVMEVVLPVAGLRKPAEPEPDDYPRAEGVASASPRVDDSEELLVELARIRSEVVERVDRQPLYVMAEQRGVPYFRLFFMTKPELFEAVLEAEGVPPGDVRPSPETAERVRALAAEAFSRHDQTAALEATNLRAG